MAKVDVEAVVVAWLNSILPSGWAAHGDKPDDNPEKYVLVSRTGGPRENIVLDKAEILIEIYHKTSQSAAKNVMLDIADRVIDITSYSENITRAKVTSTVNLDDLLAQYERYQIYCDVWGARNT